MTALLRSSGRLPAFYQVLSNKLLPDFHEIRYRSHLQSPTSVEFREIIPSKGYTSLKGVTGFMLVVSTFSTDFVEMQCV